MSFISRNGRKILQRDRTRNKFHHLKLTKKKMDTPDNEFPKNYVIKCKIDNMKIPAEKWFVGKKSVSLSFDVTPRREPDEYGRTHSIHIYDATSNSKIYIGEGTIKVFDNSNVDRTKLPPTIPGEPLAESGAPEPLISDAQVVQDSDELPLGDPIT